jgi:hypothetical protein
LQHRTGLHIALASHPLYLKPSTLTLLRTALCRAKSRIPTIRLVRTRIELLITAPLQRRANVHKGVTLDAERAFGITRIHNRGRSDATERACERLAVCLAGQDGCGGRGREGEGDDGSEELHGDD